jgi:hypothetical protein
MKKLVITTSLFFCVIICYGLTSAIFGKWTGSIKTPDGLTFPFNYVFKVDSGRMSGTVVGPDGELPILDGKVTGNDFTFILDAGGKTISDTGKYYTNGDSIAIDIDFAGLKLHSTLKRDK